MCMFNTVTVLLESKVVLVQNVQSNLSLVLILETFIVHVRKQEVQFELNVKKWFAFINISYYCSTK